VRACESLLGTHSIRQHGSTRVSGCAV